MNDPNNLGRAFEFIHSPLGAALHADFLAWARWRDYDVSAPESFNAVLRAHLLRMAEFRSLFDYRIREAGLPVRPAVCPKHRRTNDLYLATPGIGPGLRIQHGHGTWLLAESVGSGLLINQNVTVGVGRRGGKPRIGDNVSIRTGAVVTGSILIGDGVTIGPNAVVDFDVPAEHKVFAARSTIVAPKSFP